MGVTMSLHKLTAGSGYDYLTRQVAALDATEKGHVGLTSYYTERGESPGVWLGSGLDGLDGLAIGDAVTAEQMQALFGSGHHPLAKQRAEALQGPDLTGSDYQAVIRLGAPFPVYANDVSAFRIEVARRIAAVNEALGVPADWPVRAEERARIRTEVAREFFRAEHGRDPVDARELAGTIARHSRPKTNAVAGFDLTFSPVKSVSTLWALADQTTAAAIERAHQAAIKDALSFIEDHALYSRTGTGGVRQVDVRGLIATAFTHRDSRAGDPDLHTHVAVANKVQTLDGKWLAIDGRLLYKAAVTASETYNTALERHLGSALGVRFEARADTPTGPGKTAPDTKHPVREIVGVDDRLNARWSSRRVSIEARRGELAAAFQAEHGRPPTAVEALQLAQQATLETRDAKHEPRTLAQQRATWRGEAASVLGGPSGINAMLRRALPGRARRPGQQGFSPDGRSTWLRAAAGEVTQSLEARRSTWQVWHARAEAQRQVRGLDVSAELSAELVDQLVDVVLAEHSIALAKTPAPPRAGRSDLAVPEPDLLRRQDGASVYTVAGAQLHTSARILDAERRLVEAAGRRDGHAVSSSAVDVALLEATANGIRLNAGQTTLVRAMATSGTRLQLAIAPAGSGKTTAMRALTEAWTEGGGTVIGLAPSAAAAAALREQIEAAGQPAAAPPGALQRARAQTDTLAKLTWGLENDDLPDWAQHIGPRTLVLIDEAGMADTLSLDRAVAHVLARGGSVRLIGDDQQLAAIGAGGVLRDIAATHGALHLTELLRFRDPAEGSASLALREGRPDALGFYFDHRRVHVGDLAGLSHEVYEAWQADRAAGLDSIMLAPTRELVAELNARARADRVAADDGAPRPPEQAGVPRQGGAVPALVEARLADGNLASVGDLVITRSNNRRLRVSPTDWVKNGDRWRVLDVHQGGELTVQHTQHGRTVQLPADYVTASTGLGYASTTHTAQGISVDTVHGLATGEESRQLVYTMLTRGRAANHLYLQVTTDGDPHGVIRPDTVRPPTPGDVLERILSRDDSPTSASTQLREQADPTRQLAPATARYVDSLYVAAEDVLGAGEIAALERAAEAALPGLSEAAAWPALRAHLVLRAAAGEDPAQLLDAALQGREIASADDPAAVLDWRLDSAGLRGSRPGPLPWLPQAPDRMADHPTWGPYLRARADLVRNLADQVHAAAAADFAAGRSPAWAEHHPLHHSEPADARTVADIEVWRSANDVASDDRRPTGQRVLQKRAHEWQRRLNERLIGDHAPALEEWGPLLRSISPAITQDPFAALLANRLAAIARAGLDATNLVHDAAGRAQLPDEHAAAALWWRISRQLSPAAAEQAVTDQVVTAAWTPRIGELLGQPTADRLQHSSWWPALVTTIDNALRRGWQLDELLTTAASSTGTPGTADDPGGNDDAEALTWRISVLTDPPPLELTHDHPDQVPPPDLWEGVEAPGAEPHTLHTEPEPHAPAAPDEQNSAPAAAARIDPATATEATEPDLETDLHFAALAREARSALQPSQAEIDVQLRHAWELDTCPVPEQRMLEINELAREFFQHRFADSWARPYLQERFGQDVHQHPDVRPGYAPGGWTTLVDHLRRHGVSDDELLTVGLAARASTGRLIDRFRDRLVFPITRDGQVLGFIGRRRPDLTDDDKHGPKYLNTAETPLYRKGAVLFGADHEALHNGGIPVLVEGPVDAHAVTLATHGTFVGLAPLGTSLTEEQAAQLARIGRDPIIATDADLGGQLAAERDYWLLTAHGLDPAYARFPTGSDPSEILQTRGPERLLRILLAAQPLADTLLDERLTNLPAQTGSSDAAQIIAARPVHQWLPAIDQAAERFGLSVRQLRVAVLAAAPAWTRDARSAALRQLQRVHETRTRLTAARQQSATQRWGSLAERLHPGLSEQPDWPVLAGMLQAIHDEGRHPESLTRDLIQRAPLDAQAPAADLRHRIAASTGPATSEPAPPQRSHAAERRQIEERHRALRRPDPRRPGPRR